MNITLDISILLPLAWDQSKFDGMELLLLVVSYLDTSFTQATLKTGWIT